MTSSSFKAFLAQLQDEDAEEMCIDVLKSHVYNEILTRLGKDDCVALFNFLESEGNKI